MITVGVDLAAADERSGLAVVEWSPGRAVISSVEVGVSDAQIVSAILASDKAGIDSPLGFGWGLAHRGYKRAGLASDLVSSRGLDRIADLPAHRPCPARGIADP